MILLLLACGPRLPAAPDLPSDTLVIDRSTLPDVVVRGAAVATIGMPKHFAVAGADKEEVRGPVWSFVIEHPVHGLLLVDTAYGRRTVADPLDYPGKTTVRRVGLEMGTPVADLLPAIDKGPEDVQHVFLTHIHHDHAGGVEDFPDAKLWVSEADWTWGAKKRGLHGVDPLPYQDARPTHPAYDDGPYGPFAAHEDVFGDGSVLLLPAPGHTPGSQLVWVNTPTESWLFLGDATWVDEGLEGPTPKAWLVRNVVEADWKTGMDALHRVRSLRNTPDLHLVAGHEPADLERYPAWPAPWSK